MKVWIVTEGEPNIGHEFRIACVCNTEEIALAMINAFPHYGVYVTEYEVVA